MGRFGFIFGQNRSHRLWEAYENLPGAQNGNKTIKNAKRTYIENSPNLDFLIFPMEGSLFPVGITMEIPMGIPMRMLFVVSGSMVDTLACNTGMSMETSHGNSNGNS